MYLCGTSRFAAGFEQFFAEGGTPIDEEPAGPPDLDAFRRIVEKYDMELLETPGH
jgi:hypothetical protein